MQHLDSENTSKNISTLQIRNTLFQIRYFGLYILASVLVPVLASNMALFYYYYFYALFGIS
jgi:hypothetical protein